MTAPKRPACITVPRKLHKCCNCGRRGVAGWVPLQPFSSGLVSCRNVDACKRRRGASTYAEIAKPAVRAERRRIARAVEAIWAPGLASVLRAAVLAVVRGRRR